MYPVIVTDGVALEYPPELYDTKSQATQRDPMSDP
jgi:hypothetical protein